MNHLALQVPDAQHHRGAHLHTVGRVDSVHLRQPTMRVVQVEDPPSKRPTKGNVETAAHRQVESKSLVLDLVGAALGVMWKRAVTVIPLL